MGCAQSSRPPPPPGPAQASPKGSSLWVGDVDEQAPQAGTAIVNASSITLPQLPVTKSVTASSLKSSLGTGASDTASSRKSSIGVGANGTEENNRPVDAAAALKLSSATSSSDGQARRVLPTDYHMRQGCLRLGDVIPNFQVDSTYGKINLHDYFANSWGILISHPADFTPVCTTELNLVLQYASEFTKRDCKIAAFSCDSVDSHLSWAADVIASNPDTKHLDVFTYPIIADSTRDIAVQLGMLDAVAKDFAGIPLTARAMFVFAPDKSLKLSMLYPATTGRNFLELFRCLDSLQATFRKTLVETPRPQPSLICETTCERSGGLNLGDEVPNFELDTVAHGRIRLHDYIGSSWCLLLSLPLVLDNDPAMAQSEFTYVSNLQSHFSSRGVRIAWVCCDTIENISAKHLHLAGVKDAAIFADPQQDVAHALGMLEPGPQPSNAAFVVGPGKTLKLSILYPSSLARNYRELVRAMDALQLSASLRLSTPGNWRPGQECIVPPSVSAEEAKELFPMGVRIVDLPSRIGYLRFTPHPNVAVSSAAADQ